MQFEELQLVKPLLRAVAEQGYTQPSPIQQKAIPPVLAGRDLLGCAQTGTGKTAAFALPILQQLQQRSAPAKAPGPKPIRALVLTPTRELALQIQESFEAYGKYLPLRSMVIFGGVGQGPQVEKLKKGVDILVATPGRLNDLIGQGYIKLGQLEIFVLDEADRMLDMGFVQDVKKVIAHLPQKRQTLLFSATMPDEIVRLADSLLVKPAKVFVTPPATTVERIEQSVYKVDKANKRRLLAHLLRDEGVVSALVFTRTKHGADRVVRELSKEGIQAKAIHGNKSQNARQDALGRFKDGRVKVLVATDIAARGLDINELSHVFNYDLPNIPETYVHRIGRTGRAGHEGIAVSFCDFDELEYLTDIEKLIGFKVPEVQQHPWPMQVMQKAEKKQPGEKQGRVARGAAQAAPKAGRQPAVKKVDAREKAAAVPPDSRPAPAKGEQRSSAVAAAPRQKKERQQNARPPQRKGAAAPLAQNPYDNRTGGRAIITKRPVWSTNQQAAEPLPEKAIQSEGDGEMSRNNRRRRGKGRGTQNKDAQPEKQMPEIPKNERGIFDFSEEELAEDTSLKLISGDTVRTSNEAKYSSFEDYLKDH